MKQFDSSFQNVTLSYLLKELDTHVLCSGINLHSVVRKSDGKTRIHCIPKHFNLFEKETVMQDEYLRSNDCHLLIKCEGSCSECKEAEKKECKLIKQKESAINTPAKLKAPLSKTKPERVKLALQENRIKCKQLEKQIQEMKQEINLTSKPVSVEVGDEFKQIFSSCDQREIPPFMKLFWQEQQNYLRQSPSQVRYHHMIIKFCLALAAKSTSTYNELRFNKKEGTGALFLPSLRTLRDYRNVIKPKRGFNEATTADLQNKTASFTPPERYIIICVDEMKIQEDLVWDKNTGELIGFVDLGDTNINYATLVKAQDIASHVLVFLNLFSMHKGMDGKAGKEVVYRAVNLFAPDRYMFFFSDAPHLMKTARNNLSNSGSGKSSRLLWNSGQHIIWNHMKHIYEEDLDCGLKLLPKLTSDHVNITPYSAMRVHLAVQVLSSSVAAVLREYGPKEASATAEFCEKMDMFFDCLNVRNTKEHLLKRKPFLIPYVSPDDSRFAWLEGEFLKYFQDWQKSIDSKPGKFSKSGKQAMFISPQTYKGLQITIYSFVEACKFLLENGVQYILSERFCQDDLENYFGRQRAIGHSRDNPNICSVGINDNIIKSQFTVAPIAGNCQAERSKWSNISEEPLEKRQKKR
eukprot:gene12456-13744_t